ncbi:uncharacterized protein LOC141904071 [Tubulanus polymorphus]|uniref:uncharacterized protein LOC141904071 n=1 Tax=Tubulanus polymorphus TaxID=672921 RepID=UPI003DA21C52
MDSIYPCELTTDTDGKPLAKIKSPGFNPYDIDRSKFIPEWSLERLMTANRLRALYSGDFLDWNKVMQGKMVFFVGKRTEIARNFYNRDLLIGPLMSEVKLGYVGKSSYNTINTLSHAETGQQIASEVSQLVLIDPKVRKPVPLPGWWVDKYASFTAGGKSMRVEILVKPKSSFIHQTKVRHSDMDGYGHTNFASYVQFSLNAAACATADGHFKGFQNDIVNYPMKSSEMTFKGESTAEDILNVATWEDSNNQKIIHCQIYKATDLIYQQTMTFYDSFLKNNS